MTSVSFRMPTSSDAQSLVMIYEVYDAGKCHDNIFGGGDPAALITDAPAAAGGYFV